MNIIFLKNPKLSRAILSLLLFCFITSSLSSLSLVNKVQATGIPVVDVALNSNLVAATPPVITPAAAATRTIKSILTTYIMSGQWKRDLIDFARKTAFEILRQAILDKLVNNLVKWIEGGGRGAIVDDWDAFFQDAANRAGGVFANNISNGFLCGPFNLQVQMALLPVKTFDSVTCTLNDVITNIDGFMEDFRNGSWLGYQSTWEPRNNFYGATLIAMDEKTKEEYRAKDAAASEAAAGKGFLSFKKCDFVKDANGTVWRNGSPIEAGKKLADARMAGIAYRKSCVIKTPGDVAASAATEALVKRGIIKASSATSELLVGYLTQIVNASANVLTAAAVDGFKGVVSDALKDTKINPVLPCAGMTGEGFKSCMAAVNSEKKKNSVDKEVTAGIIKQSIELRYQLAGIYAQSISLQQGFVDALNQLAACRSNPVALAAQIQEEQLLLDDLQLKFADNQSVIAPIEQRATKTSAPIGQGSLTSADMEALGNIDLSGSDDSMAVSIEIELSRAQLQTIKDKLAEQLPGLELQLQSCPALATSTPPIL